MTAKQVAKLMAQFLGHKDLLSTTTLDGETEPSSEQSQILSSYLNCINDVVQSLAISYFPLKQKQQLVSQNNQYPYSLFSMPLLQIVSVYDAFSNTKLRFESLDDHFVVDSNKIDVVYHYQPTYVSAFDDSLDISKTFVTPRLVALGAVSRFYLLDGLHSESQAWNNMFERAVLVAKRPRRNLYISKRSWF